MLTTTKSFFFEFFCFLLFEGTFTSVLKDQNSYRSCKEVVIKVFFLFLLDDGRIRIQKAQNIGSTTLVLELSTKEEHRTLPGVFELTQKALKQNGAKRLILHLTKCPPLRVVENKATTVVAQKGPNSTVWL
jgi:hypothetical protein